MHLPVSAHTSLKPYFYEQVTLFLSTKTIHCKMSRNKVAGYTTLPRLAPLLRVALLLAALQALYFGPLYGQDNKRLSFNRTKPLHQIIVDLQTLGGLHGYCLGYDPALIKYRQVTAFNADSLLFPDIVRKLAAQEKLIDTFIHFCHELRPDKQPMAIAAKKTAIVVCKGHVQNEKGEPLPGVSVEVKRTGRGTETDSSGNFDLGPIYVTDTVMITHVTYDPWKDCIGSRRWLTITLATKMGELKEVTTGLACYTRQASPTNVADAHEGRPGMELSPDFTAMLDLSPGVAVDLPNGAAGTAKRVVIRGFTSLGVAGGTGNLPPGGPLYIIDGVPLAADNNLISQYKSIAGDPNKPGFDMGGLGILGYINMLDIESVTVLKDAAATSLYGSRGANGVILIATKKARPGKTSVSVSLFTGLGWIPQWTELLDTRQYVAMRKEAFANDGRTPTLQNAPDLFSWDTTRYTNFRKLIQGGKAAITNAQVSLTGGNRGFAYRVSTAMRRETSVLPVDSYWKQWFVNGNLATTSRDKRLRTSTTLLYALGNLKSNTNDMSQGMFLAPNAPRLTDSTGALYWDPKVRYVNPMYYALNTYYADINTLNADEQVHYNLSRHFSFHTNLGINTIRNEETSLFPIAAQAPSPLDSGASSFGNNYYRSLFAQQQAMYHYGDSSDRLSLDVMAGTTFQHQVNRRSTIDATGFTSDELLRQLAASSHVAAWNAESQYNYEAQFASVNAVLDKTFYLFGTARRDGSSRFGAGHRIGTFGALSLGWAFCRRDSAWSFLPSLHFGKLMLIYGTTGNDQIGDYRYQETYSTSDRTYAGVSALSPDQPNNPGFSWELTKKLDVVLELEFPLFTLTADAYLNRTSNQVVSSTLPAQTGFAFIANRNIPAIVQNTGLELLLTKNPAARFRNRKDHLRWTATLAATFARNKLVAFPGQAASSYKSLIVGESLTSQTGYYIGGPTPDSGLYKPADQDGNGVITAADANYLIGNTDPRFYLGFHTSLAWRSFQLDITLDGRQQLGNNPMVYFYTYAPPGRLNQFMYTNQSVAVLDRWRKPGDVAAVQKLSSSSTSRPSQAIEDYKKSSQALVDASYLRIKNICLSYTLPSKHAGTQYSLYLQAQNIFTFTHYRDADPITQAPETLPPLRTVSCGVRLTF